MYKLKNLGFTFLGAVLSIGVLALSIAFGSFVNKVSFTEQIAIWANGNVKPVEDVKPSDVWEPVAFEAGRKILGFKVNKNLAFTDWKPNIEGLESRTFEGMISYKFFQGKGPDISCELIKITDLKIVFPDYEGTVSPDADLWVFQSGANTITFSNDLKEVMKNMSGDFSLLTAYEAMTVRDFRYIYQSSNPCIFTEEEAANMNRLTDLISPIYEVTELPENLMQSGIENSVQSQTENITLPSVENQLGNIFEK